MAADAGLQRTEAAEDAEMCHGYHTVAEEVRSLPGAVAAEVRSPDPAAVNGRHSLGLVPGCTEVEEDRNRIVAVDSSG